MMNFVDIKKRDIMNFQNYLIKQGLSPARIRVLRSSISSLSNFIENILDEEEKYENFRNIVNKIPAPTLQAVREKTVISDEEVEVLLDTLVKKNKIQQIQVLYLLFAIVMGYIISQFFLDFLTHSQNLIYFLN